MLTLKPNLKDRVTVRLLTKPQCFNMCEFSKLGSIEMETSYCLAGTILDECGVRMEYGANGLAIGLAAGEKAPPAEWIDFELSIAAIAVDPRAVVIAAKARELWAIAYGEKAAKLLPFYAADWELDQSELGTVRVEAVVDILQCIYELSQAHSTKTSKTSKTMQGEALMAN